MPSSRKSESHRKRARYNPGAPPVSPPLEKPTPIIIKVHPSSPLKDPVVVSFPSGLPAAPSSTSSCDKDPAFFGLHPAGRSIQSVRKTLADGNATSKCLSSGDYAIHGTDGACTYVSSPTAPSRSSDIQRPLTKLLVGVLEGNILHLRLAAGDGKVRVMTPHVCHPQEHDLDEAATTEYATSINKLYTAFGSTKQQRNLKTQAMNRVTVDKVVGGSGMLDAMAKGGGIPVVARAGDKETATGNNGSINPSVGTSIEESRRAFLPPYNQDAKEPHLVYSIEEMAGEEVWEYITNKIKFVVAVHRKKIKDEGEKKAPKTWMEALVGKNVSLWPPSLLDLVRTINLDTRRKEDTRRLKQILFLCYMVRFIEACDEQKRSHGQSQKKNNFLRGSLINIGHNVDVPEMPLRRFLHLFTFDQETGEPANTFSIPNDKLGIYKWTQKLIERRNLFALLVYSCAAGGKDMRVADIKGIMQDIKTDSVSARRLISQAGFLSKVNADKSISVVLKVPLTFPRGKRKRA